MKLKQRFRNTRSIPNLQKANIKYISDIVDIITTIDKDGVISEVSIADSNRALFDTVAVRLVLATKGMWEPAMVKGKPQGRVITIPVNFLIKVDSLNNAIEYSVNIFASDLKLSSDSSNTFPAIVETIDSTILFNSKKFKGHLSSKGILKYVNKKLFDDDSPNPVFGSVRLGFNLSKDGKISDVNILHSVSKKYDDRALSCLKVLEPKFTPAHENGIPIDSYIEFDFRFDSFVFSADNKKMSGNLIKSYFMANELLKVKNYEMALPYLIKVHNYYLDDIKILFQLALVHFQLNKIEEGCEYLSKLKSVAIDTLYPSTVNEEDVIALYETYCK